MKNQSKREALNLILVAIPFIYLGFIYGGLPAEVPMHWNGSGEIDRMGSKRELWLIPFLLPLLTYGIMSLVPALDPKMKIEKMGGKFHSLKTMLVGLLSALALYIIYVAAHPDAMRMSMVVIFLGILFMGLGNFFKTIQPNYFLGIRTPWTLESETVWKNTHLLAGKLWMIGGLIMVMIGIFYDGGPIIVLTVAIAIIVSLIPLGYSYFAFKQTAS